MKGNGALPLIFAFFLGLVVTGFVGIGVATFYPEPDWSLHYDEGAAAAWRLGTGIILLVCATLLLAVSLALPATQVVISNGVLLGGVFTMIYAVGVTVSSQQSIWRFVVVAVALAVTVGIGYLKFARRPVPPVVAGEGSSAAVGDLAERVSRLEAHVSAVRRALD